MIKANSNFDWSKTPHPLHTLIVKVTDSSREALLKRVKKLANERKLEFYIARIHNLKMQFGVDIWSRDVAIAGQNISDLSMFEFGVYSTANAEVVDAFVQQFQAAVEEVPDVSFARTK